MTPEEQKRIVDAGFNEFKKLVDQEVSSAERSAFDEIIGRIVSLNAEVKAHIKPILDAGGGKDSRALEHTIQKLYAHAFSKFAKQELEEIAAWMLTSCAMEGIYPNKMGVQPKL